MIRSMTGYARQSCQTPMGSFTWECRAVNHRYLETYFKLPEELRELEPLCRERARKALGRGKFEANLKFTPNPNSQPCPEFNLQLAKNILATAENLSNNNQIDILKILQWPGVMISPEQNTQEIIPEILVSFDNALESLINNRTREGTELKEFILIRLNKMRGEINNLKNQMPELLQNQKNKLKTKLGELVTEGEPERLEQEMLLLIHKQDIDEECDRLTAHFTEINKILDKGGLVGRRLDFLMQELNREANTLGSKSADLVVTQTAVELKVLIEQMREQIQNIE